MNTASLDTSDLLSELLKQGIPVRLPVKGQSMRPFLHNGDMITVIPCSGNTLRAGDIGAYLADDGKITLHRALAHDTDGGTWSFRGDASRGVVDSVPELAILGRVSRVERQGHIVYRDNFLYRWAGRIWQRCSYWRYQLTGPRHTPPVSGAPRTDGE